MREIIRFHGHPNIKATHTKTLEVTREGSLGPTGDCIIGVSADKACSDLNPRFKEVLRREGSRLVVTIVVEGESHVVRAYGSPKLAMTDPHDVVIRKSGFTNCRRTIGIRADGAAGDLPRSLVRKLQRGAEGTMILEAYPPG